MHCLPSGKQLHTLADYAARRDPTVGYTVRTSLGPVTMAENVTRGCQTRLTEETRQTGEDREPRHRPTRYPTSPPAPRPAVAQRSPGRSLPDRKCGGLAPRGCGGSKRTLRAAGPLGRSCGGFFPVGSIASPASLPAGPRVYHLHIPSHNRTGRVSARTHAGSVLAPVGAGTHPTSARAKVRQRQRLSRSKRPFAPGLGSVSLG
jgi:hypothetical protein